ncbi:MAG: hypothetical protein HKO59_12135 [Phycisphaerales bacterium]|nr:hypothetical protein [Phycisphaerae bacterium]NNF44285.1 hypothetical protein [Phycisphaerales bacterium]NNM26711.1 hypothetical protein [Phycisphaerales bacterium]
MPSPKERRRNNLRAGLFATISIAGLVAVTVLLSDIRDLFEANPRHYTVRFEVTDGIKSLQPGSGVRVGGLGKGKVDAVELVARGDAMPPAIDVDFTLDNDVTLYPGARVMVTAAIIGSEAWIEITDLGAAQGPDGAPITPLSEGDVIDGSNAPGMLDTLVGPDADRILSNVTRASDFLGTLDEKYDTDILPIAENVNAATGDVRQMMAELREKWPPWLQRADDVMTWTGELTDRVDEAVEEGRAMLGAGRAMVTDNRPAVDETIENVRSASGEIREASVTVNEITADAQTRLVDKLDAILDTAQAALDHAESTVERVRVDYEGWSREIGGTIASAELAAQQLKLTMVEVRRSPWKVLYRPTDQELEHELLYEAARSFALATADLRAAADSVDGMLSTHGARLRENPELFERVQRNLVDPLRNYEEAQQRLLDVLFTEQ